MKSSVARFVDDDTIRAVLVDSDPIRSRHARYQPLAAARFTAATRSFSDRAPAALYFVPFRQAGFINLESYSSCI
ncbi:hypothetical protein [Burkholderia sp. PU8-34]